jgi:hypothetical protein
LDSRNAVFHARTGIQKATSATRFVSQVTLALDLARYGAGYFLPTPMKYTLCGLPTALSVMIAYALSGTATEAVKVTVMLHLAPGARDLQVLVSVKSALFRPVIAILLMVNVEFPLLLSPSTFLTGVPIVEAGKVQQGFDK